MEIIFVYKYFAGLFIFLLALYLAIYFYSKQKGYYLPTFKIFQQYSKKYISLDHLSLLIKFIAISMLILAVMRPQVVITEVNEKQEVIDVFIALDISLSMQVEDLQPNRIEAAKKTVQSFLTKIKGNRIGTIIFAGIAFVQSPLTFDMKVVYDLIGQTTTQTINQNMFGLDGTAIGDAIFTGVEKLKENETETKIIILLTDGEANRGADPIVAAQYAADNDIKIYTIGIGDPEEAIIPIIDNMGRKSYLIGPDGEPLKTKINTEPLQKVADITGGKFFMAEDNESFEKVFEEIVNLEKTPVERVVNTKYQDLYRYPLGVAIFLLLIEYFWFERRRV